jgi:hypothetical protein
MIRIPSGDRTSDLCVMVPSCLVPHAQQLQVHPSPVSFSKMARVNTSSQPELGCTPSVALIVCMIASPVPAYGLIHTPFLLVLRVTRK